MGYIDHSLQDYMMLALESRHESDSLVALVVLPCASIYNSDPQKGHDRCNDI